MISYAITREVWNGFRAPITEGEAQSYIEADKALTAVMDIEESFDVVVGNYLAFEKQVLGLIIEDAVHGFSRRAHFDQSRRDCHRHLSNLLSCGRNFVETLTHRLGVIGGDEQTWAIAAFSREYDAHFAYRLMDALRNHVMHIGRAVSGVGFDMRHGNAGADGGTPLIHSMQPTIHPDSLVDFPKFKKSVLNELSKLVDRDNGKALDLVPIVRRYVTSLGEVLRATRDHLEEREHRWRGTVLEAERRMADADREAKHKFGLEITAYGSDTERVSGYRMFPDEIQRIADLREQNPALYDLSRLQVER